MTHIIGAMAEFGRELIKERVKAGLDKVIAMRQEGLSYRKIANLISPLHAFTKPMLIPVR